MGDETRLKFPKLWENEWSTLKEGDGWIRPEKGYELTISAIGRTKDGEEVDRKESVKFILGADGVVPDSWTEALCGMTKGDMRKVPVSDNEKTSDFISDQASSYDVELTGWIARRDLFQDGTAIEATLEDGKGWERPSMLSEVKIQLSIYSSPAEERLIFDGPEKQISLADKSIPEVLSRCISAMRKESMVGIECNPDRSKEISDYVGVELNTNCFVKLSVIDWVKVEDIYHDRTVVKQMIKEGLGWEIPGEGGTATLHLAYKKGRDSDEIIWSDEKTVVVGDGSLPDSLDSVVETMKRGEKAQISATAERAFSPVPDLAPPGVDPNQEVLLEIEMKDFARAVPIWVLGFEEGLEKMTETKEMGNKLVKSKRYEKAISQYQRVDVAMDRSRQDLTAHQRTLVDEIRASALVNVAVCYDKIGDYQKMFDFADKAVSVKPSNVRALYRRGSAYLKLGNLYRAQADLRYAVELDAGKNPEVRGKLREINSLISKEEEEERRKYSKSFQSMFTKG